SGPHTICMKLKRSATGCCSSHAAGSCSKVIRRGCRASMVSQPSKNFLLPWRVSRSRSSACETMNLSRTFAVVLRHFYLMRGSPARVLPLFAWVGIDMVLWGFITKYLNAITSAGFDFIPVLLGSVLLWDFFIRVMHGVTMAFLEDVWSRNFLNFFATP